MGSLWQSVLSILVVGGVAGALHGMIMLTDNWILSTSVSAMGCYASCTFAIVVVWALIAVEMEWDERPPSQVTYSLLMFVIPGLLAIVLCYIVNELIGIQWIVAFTEAVGCFLVVICGITLAGAFSEWRQRRRTAQSNSI